MDNQWLDDDFLKDLNNLGEEHEVEQNLAWNPDLLFGDGQDLQNTSRTLNQQLGEEMIELPTTKSPEWTGLQATSIEAPEAGHDHSGAADLQLEFPYLHSNTSKLEPFKNTSKRSPSPVPDTVPSAENPLMGDRNLNSTHNVTASDALEQLLQTIDDSHSKQTVCNPNDPKEHQNPQKSSTINIEGANILTRAQGPFLDPMQNAPALETQDSKSDESLDINLSQSEDEVEATDHRILKQRQSHRIVQMCRLSSDAREKLNVQNNEMECGNFGHELYIKQETETSMQPVVNLTSDENVSLKHEQSSSKVLRRVRISTPSHSRTSKKQTWMRMKKPTTGRGARNNSKNSSRVDIRDRHMISEQHIGLRSERKENDHEDKESTMLTLEDVRELDIYFNPLPELENELEMNNDSESQTENITIELTEEELQSPTIQYLRRKARSFENVEMAGEAKTISVPDVFVFETIYSLVKSVILYRREADIACFVSYVMNKSINKSRSGYFSKKFIQYVEKLLTPRNLRDFHNYVFEKVPDSEITKVQRAIEFRLADRISVLKPEHLTNAFIRKLEIHRNTHVYVKEKKKYLADCAKEYKKKRKYLAKHGVKYAYSSHPRFPPDVDRKKSDLKRRTEQFAHDFTWYSRELFMGDSVESHYFLARFMMNEIHNRKTEEILKHKVGKIGDVDRSQYFVDMEAYNSKVWTKIIKELREFLCFADPAGLMEALCKDLDQKCKLILTEVSDEMNPPQTRLIAHAVLIPVFGNHIGSYSAKAFGRAADKIDWKKKTIEARTKNLDSVTEAYETYIQNKNNI